MLERMGIFGTALEILSNASEYLKRPDAYKEVKDKLLTLYGSNFDKREYENLLIHFFKITTKTRVS